MKTRVFLVIFLFVVLVVLLTTQWKLAIKIENYKQTIVSNEAFITKALKTPCYSGLGLSFYTLKMKDGRLIIPDPDKGCYCNCVSHIIWNQWIKQEKRP